MDNIKKPILVRILAGCAQHLIAAAAIVFIIMIAYSTRIVVTDGSGNSRLHSIDILEEAGEFADSRIFQSMFSEAAYEVIQLAVLKGQLESNGYLDLHKDIDVTAYANRKSGINNCNVTAVYELGDLLEWGEYGVEKITRTMSKHDFVCYLGSDILDYSNFYLNEAMQLKFLGFREESSHGADLVLSEEETYKVEETLKIAVDEGNFIDSSSEAARITVEDDPELLYGIYSYYSEEDLIDMVFEYYVNNIANYLSIGTDHEGAEVIEFSLLQCLYTTVDGHGQLSGIASNWIEYFQLEENVITAINDLTYNYNHYNNQKNFYDEDISNIRYYIQTGSGTNRQIITNLRQVPDDITDYFGQLGRYIIYYVDEDEYQGNMADYQSWLISSMSNYEYVYSKGTRIWIGLDTTYPVANDSFVQAAVQYDNINSRLGSSLTWLAAAVVAWLIIWIYLTVTAGWAKDVHETRILYVNGFDCIWTELSLAILLVVIAAAIYALLYLADITLTASAGSSTYAILIGAAALCGFFASLTFSAVWYSMVRKLKSRRLWSDSLLRKMYDFCYNIGNQIRHHGNSVVRTLIPYNIYLLINLIGVFFIFRYILNGADFFLFLMGGTILLVLDASVGVVLFRRNAEMKDIVEGINRIREGDAAFQLDVNKLHGESKELAEAVNNIGEGIRKAVETSMKDERMKTDLITNVSHDIKTPLTSIINYVDLLKRERIQAEPVKTYIDILDAKSQRLKQLTDDLVEASKISSGNIVLDNEMLELTELLNQAIGEFSEKFEQRELQVIFEGLAVPAYIYADSRRMWRIIENLFNNICKYAMPKTRVYVDMWMETGQIVVSIKNISEQPLNISPDELTERFIRGDSSRTTEGSGLGLSITKSLTEVQGGYFLINLDGDLFKTILTFPEYKILDVTE